MYLILRANCERVKEIKKYRIMVLDLVTCSGALQVSTGSPAGDTGRKLHDAPRMPSIPINGTASDVVGIFSATRLRKTVNERSMVTPEMKILNFERVRVRGAIKLFNGGLYKCYCMCGAVLELIKMSMCG